MFSHPIVITFVFTAAWLLRKSKSLVCKMFFLLVVCTLFSSELVQSANVVNVNGCQRHTTSDLKYHDKKPTVPANSEKCFLISLPNPEDEVVIVFVQFILLDSDSVEIYRYGLEKNDSLEMIFGPFQGQKGMFSVFTGHSSVVLLLKTSQETSVERLFHAKNYTNDCKYEDPASIWGTVRSPFYERTRTTPVQCSYDFGFTGSTYHLQKFVFDVVDKNLTRAKFTVAGSELTDDTYQAEIPARFISAGRFKLHVQIDPALPDQYFVATYRLATSVCSGVVEVVDGSVSFGLPQSLVPQKPHSGPSAARCHWLVRGLVGSPVYVVLVHSSVDYHELLTFGGPGTTSENRHLAADRMVSSDSNELLVDFVSDNIRPGASLLLKASQHVGNVSFDSVLRNSGIFTLDPPSYGVGLLQADATKKRVFLTLPSPPRGGVIDLYSDFDDDSSLFLSLQPSSPLDSVVSPTSQMRVRSQSKLRASFSSVDAGCHQVSQGESDLYVVSNPCGTCTWLVNPTTSCSGSTVELMFLKLNLGPRDVLSIYRLDGNLTKVASMDRRDRVTSASVPCGSGILLNITSPACSVSLRVAYTLQPNCRKEFRLRRSGQSVDILSPLFPDSYPFGSDCRWHVDYSGGSFLLVDVQQIRLASHDHRLSLNGRGVASILISHNEPHYYLLKCEAMTVALFAPWFSNLQQSFSSSGFQISVTALDCGGALKNGNGFVSIPSRSRLCVWVPEHNDPRGNSTFVSFSTSATSRNVFVRQWTRDRTTVDTPLTSGLDVSVYGLSFALVYNLSSSSDRGETIRIKYSMHKCEFSRLCGSNKCMDPTWICNGINDCGDYTDELNCTVSTFPDIPTTSRSSDRNGTVETPQRKGSDDGSVSLTHVSLYVAVATIFGASIPSFVYCCLLKRGKGKTDSQWSMIANGNATQNNDNISL